MARLRMKIGELIEAMADYKGETLHPDRELVVSELDCRVPSRSGFQTINHVISKQAPGTEIFFEDGHLLKCASRHVMRSNGKDVFADELSPGDYVDTATGRLKIDQISASPHQDFYDIGIDAPHRYFDAHGIEHHNTIMTGAMSRLCEPYGRTIIIVPNKSLVGQTEADYRTLGLDVGVFYGERKEFAHQHTICTWQSLSVLSKKTRRGETEFPIDEFLAGVVCVIVDEVHSAKAKELKELLCGPFKNVAIRWGLTGTVPQDEFDFMTLLVTLGPVVGQIKASDLQEQGVLARCEVEIVQTRDEHVAFRSYQEEHEWLTGDRHRLAWIAGFVRSTAQSGNTLVLVERIESGEQLEALIPGSVFVNGAMKTKKRMAEYKEVQTTDNKIIVATYGVAAVGINIPRIFNLVLIEPGKSFVRVIQSIGRGIRKAKDKDFVAIKDIASTLKYSARHLSKRRGFYRDASYPAFTQKVSYR